MTNQQGAPEALYASAMEFAAEKASISYVQRKCRCSWNDAEQMLERMVREGIIATYNGRKSAALVEAQQPASKEQTMTEPTDAEIWQMWMPMVRRMGVADPVEFARAVLAKWGTPAVAGEPVAWVDERAIGWLANSRSGAATITTTLGRQKSFERPMPLHTTPQPTQAQSGAVPLYRLLQSGVDRIEAADEFLSDDTTAWAIDPNGIFVGSIYGGHVLRPARRCIKGGQHGAE